MNVEVIKLTQEALWLMLLLSAPFIIGAAIVGLLLGFLQAVTQLQEQTLSFGAKLGLLSMLLFLSAGLLGESLYQFASRIFTSFPALVG